MIRVMRLDFKHFKVSKTVLWSQRDCDGIYEVLVDTIHHQCWRLFTTLAAGLYNSFLWMYSSAASLFIYNFSFSRSSLMFTIRYRFWMYSLYCDDVTKFVIYIIYLLIRSPRYWDSHCIIIIIVATAFNPQQL